MVSWRIANPLIETLSQVNLDVFASCGRESRPGESHPEALAEPYVTLSRHTAPIKEPPRIVAQGANRCGERRETAATHRLARRT
jgi:hypothetical protein